MSEGNHYRQGVVAFVLNATGEILVCSRIDYPDSWQLPQGGADDGESIEETLLRELAEEIGTSDVDVLYEVPQRIRYEFPEWVNRSKFVGQEHAYFAVRLREGATVDVLGVEHPEFCAFRWVSADEFRELGFGFKNAAYIAGLEAVMAGAPGAFGGRK